MTEIYDCAVVGAGICGLAHALAAARRGKRVVVLERDLAARGASIRNFGLITVTGQEAGRSWAHAHRSRQIWEQVIERSGIAAVQVGMLVTARRPETLAVLEAFRDTEMGTDCRMLDRAALARHAGLRTGSLLGALHSPHEIRVESRTAIPQLAAWLQEAHGVAFHYATQVHSVAPPRIETSRGPIGAETVVICPGDDFLGLGAERLAGYGLTRCALQMLRLAPAPGAETLPAVMSDLGVARYRGYHRLPGADALRQVLAAEQPEHLQHGVHLIAVRSADGTQVVGDSHRYEAAPELFARQAIDDLILDEYRAVFEGEPRVMERWIGTYASGPETMIVDRPSASVRIVVISSGTGASTAFAIAEDTIAEFWSAEARSIETREPA